MSEEDKVENYSGIEESPKRGKIKVIINFLALIYKCITFAYEHKYF